MRSGPAGRDRRGAIRVGSSRIGLRRAFRSWGIRRGDVDRPRRGTLANALCDQGCRTWEDSEREKAGGALDDRGTAASHTKTPSPQ